MIQYTYPWPETAPTLKVPVLHKVYFTRYQIAEIISAIRRIAEMRDWLEANCRAPYYVAPGWADNFVEFEDDQDATAFALRWS